jgi:hypothetical protein
MPLCHVIRRGDLAAHARPRPWIERVLVTRAASTARPRGQPVQHVADVALRPLTLRCRRRGDLVALGTPPELGLGPRENLEPGAERREGLRGHLHVLGVQRGVRSLAAALLAAVSIAALVAARRRCGDAR